ncbi:MAG: alanine--tRNA ligase [Defluviitaleaceae bacterium]|nr:alanine--tRNA ligase [Defluviitaleaceae bacterium]
MKSLTVNQIRDRYLDLFAAKGHHLLQSSPLVPQGDNSLLLINSGVATMKAFFTGQEKPPAPRVASCQKCIRTTDIDDVGKDARHGSFFEMLGNFSFGDYFKKEVIPWAWEFLTVEMGIPADKLSVSVYEEDDEAYDIWHDVIGLAPEKIFKLDKAENFWEHGVGPCGPCSEIHFDRGAEAGCGKPGCQVGCDCDRFMEVWNLVFTQFNKNEDGSYSPLELTGIDTGMGLERLAIVLQEAPSIFDIDNIRGIRQAVLELAGLETATGSKLVSANIIADHVRSVAFMAADGVLPSNEGRGYILRRLLRRAVRHGQSLGINGAFVVAIAKASIDAYSHAYANLTEKESFILQTLGQEESRFMETLDTGMNLLQKQMDSIKANGKSTISGADAFKLYDTYGFPPDLTREILEDAGLKFDEDGFKREMEAQKQRARQARGVSNYMGADETVYHRLEPNMPTLFCGYEADTCQAKILAIVAGDGIVDSATAGQEISLVLDNTPFYAESGGQKGDGGKITANDLAVEIYDCINVAGGNTVHVGKVISGTVKKGATVTATIDTTRRQSTTGNHSATHLLQKALREVLGDHVEQSGSEVSQDRLRFDFTHNAPLSAEQRDQIETLVNQRIWQAIPVDVMLTTPEEARKSGAMALFGEKYGDTVRMVKMGDQSIELCGGTHVANTQQIGVFKLLSEGGIASGVRRIEATTGLGAINVYREAHKTLQAAAELCKVQKPQDLPARLDAILAENKELKKELTKIQSEASGQEQAEVVASLCKNAETHGGFTLLAGKLENYDIEAMRNVADMLRKDIKSGCVLLCGVNAGAAQFLAFATDDAVKAGIHAGEIVKEAAKICGGGGGGKPSQAQAGGKNAENADAALAKAIELMKSML